MVRMAEHFAERVEKVARSSRRKSTRLAALLGRSPPERGITGLVAIVAHEARTGQRVPVDLQHE